MRSGMLRPASLAIAALMLGIGPWLGLPTTSFLMDTTSAFADATGGTPAQGRIVDHPQPPPRPRLSAASGCSCREVVVDASNVVRDAEVRTGDAKVVNKSITYIAPTFGDVDVDVEQEAEARSGDAVAGQILAVDGGEGCSRVRVTARNVVEDADVRSGDALARNKSLILLDPSITREDLEIEVDQEAVAESGDAVAGQIIGVRGGGPCGGVILDALNRVRNVDLRTGEATIENWSDILTCTDEGCIDDIRRLLGDVQSVDVCGADGCDAVPIADFIQLLKDQAAGEEPTASVDEDDDEPEKTVPPRFSNSPAERRQGEIGEYRPYHPRDPALKREDPRTPTKTPQPTVAPTPF